MPKLVFLVGPVGSGKTVSAQEFSKMGFLHLTIDHYYLTTPRTKKGTFYKDYEFVKKSWARLRQDISRFLETNQNVLFESTGTTVQWKRLFKYFKSKYGKRVFLISITSPAKLIKKRITKRNKEYAKKKIPITISEKILKENLSEFKKFPFKPDYEIQNNGSMEALTKKTRKIPLLNNKLEKSKKQIYSEKAIYCDILFSESTNAQLSFLQKIFKFNKNPSKICLLDAACGTGRLTIPFAAKTGFSILGMDKSPEMISVARQNALGLFNVSFVQQDISKVDLEKVFDGIFCMFTSFNYLADENAIMHALLGFYKSLKKNGLLVLDLCNFMNYIDNFKKQLANSFKQDGIQITQLITHKVDKIHNLWEHQEKVICSQNGQSKHSIKETHILRYITYCEMMHYLEKAGFSERKIRFFTNYELNKPNPQNAPRLIFVAQK